MTAPISNGPATTRLHHYAGHYFVPWVCAAWLVSGGLREKILPARVVCVWTVTIFSLLALDGLKWAFFAVLGEFCTGCGLTRRVLGEFCTGACALRGWWVVVCEKRFSLLGL